MTKTKKRGAGRRKTKAKKTTTLKPGGLTAEQAAIVLKADAENLGDEVKKALRKVAEGKRLTWRERGEVEGIVANARAQQITTSEDDAKAHPTEIEFNRLRRQKMVEERRLRWPPMTIRQIADELKISTQTVVFDLDAIKLRRAEWKPGNSDANLAAVLEQFDDMIAENRALAAQYTAPSAKASFLAIAGRLSVEKAKFMGDTGVINLAPKRIQPVLPGDPSGGIPAHGPADVLILPALEDEEPVEVETTQVAQ